MELHIDIISTDLMLGFVVNNNLDNDIHEETSWKDVMKLYFTKNKHKLLLCPNNKETVRINHQTIKVGDDIDVSYIPCSQKFIDHYNEKSFTGRVFYVDHSKCGIALVYYDEIVDGKITRYVKSVETEYCSYFGDTRGYDIIIDRYEENIFVY